MLKKLVAIFISIFMLFNISSCKNKVSDKILLSGNFDNQKMIELDKEELKDKILNQEDFLLVIKLEGCSSCETFENEVINPFIKETFSDVYYIYAHNLDSMDKFDNKPKYKLAPNIQVYKQGKSVLSANYDDTKDYFTNLNSFKEFISEYVVFPSIITASEETLDALISSNKEFVLYIGWNKCGDCVSVYDNVLKQYLLESKSNNKLVYLEVDSYRSKKPAICPSLEGADQQTIEDYNNYMEWVNFAKKYNFYDYKDGKVPTFQYYKNGSVVEQIVYKNDEIVDGKIVDSFYKELIGQTLSNEDLINYHNNKLIEFLNKYF